MTFEELIGRKGEEFTIDSNQTSEIDSFSTDIELATIQFLTRNLVINNQEYGNISASQIGKFSYSIKGVVSSSIANSFNTITNGTDPAYTFKSIWGATALWTELGKSLEYSIDLGSNIDVGKTMLAYYRTNKPIDWFSSNIITSYSLDYDSSFASLVFSIKNLKDNLEYVLKTAHKIEIYGTKLTKGSTDVETLFHTVGNKYRDLPAGEDRKKALDEMRSNLDKSVAEKQYESYSITEGFESTVLRTTPYLTDPFDIKFNISSVS